MVPTARAAALREPVRRGLVELSRALASSDFDPREARRTFTLSSADFVSALLLPALLDVLLREAPGVDLNVRPADVQRDIHFLEAGELDGAMLVGVPERTTLRCVRLFTESFACLVRKDHPEVGESLSLETFARLSHALISPRGSGPSFVDNALAERGLSRRIALRIPFFLAAPMIIARSDLILTAPRRVALQFAESLPLRVIEPPLPLASFSVHLVWHERDDTEPAHTWLRKAICRAAESATEETSSSAA
jgi:DNA-binding transcriptional LysR family regulator